MAVDIEHRALALGAFASHYCWCCASSEGGRDQFEVVRLAIDSNVQCPLSVMM